MPRRRTSRGRRRYGPGASRKVEKAMHERKRGSLRSGSGKRVKSREQAIAIGLNEARREGAKVPRRGGASRSSRNAGSRSRSSRARRSSRSRSRG